MDSTSVPVRRLRNYWKIEAMNVVLIPAAAAYIVLHFGGKITLPLVLCMCACSFLLVIGTVALRMMLRKAEGIGEAADHVVPLLARLRWPAVALCVAAAAACGYDWATGGLHLSPDRVVSLLVLLLAVLEYINYYHVQIQHFDHAADWQRLLAGRGFRRSHLAREIERWNRKRTRAV